MLILTIIGINLIFCVVDKQFHSLLQGRFQRPQNDPCMKDIYDGKVYQGFMSEDGFLRDPMNVSLIMNTDGSPVFKSSRVSLWPVYMAINELLPHLKSLLMHINYSRY